MSNLELIQALIERTDKVAQEAPQFEYVPMLAKAQTMAMLYQAAALERIAASLELVVEALALTHTNGLPLRYLHESVADILANVGSSPL